MFLYFIFIIAMEKLNNIKEGIHKRNPIKMDSLTSKQLKELLHPTRTEEQEAAIEVVKAMIEKIKNDKNRSWLTKLEGDIQKAEELGLDMTRYKKKLAFLEEEMWKAAIKKNETSLDKPAKHNAATILRHMEAVVQIRSFFEDPEQLKEELDAIKEEMKERAMEKVEFRINLVKGPASLWLEELKKSIEEAEQLGLNMTEYRAKLMDLLQNSEKI